MSMLLLVAILCTGSALSQVQVPCYGEGCANVTVYLGPRWGSRVIMVPRTETTTGPGEVSEHRYEHEERRPQHRPVPLGGKFHVNFSDDESSYTSTPSPFRTTSNTYRWLFPWATRRPWRTTTNRPNPEVGVVVTRGTLDLSWRGYTGADVNQVFQNLSVFDRFRVSKLILDSNRLWELPVSMFPVEFKYSLQELSLANNPFRPPHITACKGFALSKLTRLKTLNMSHDRLESFEILDIPSLEVLDLSYNQLSSLPNSLASFGSLLQLFLRGNYITYIFDHPLSSLTNLLVLDLGDNGLREFQGEPLENIRSFVTIKLDNNRLRSLPMLDSERTKIVFIANNSLECSCSLLRLISWHNAEFQYDYLERCQDGNQTIPLQELRWLPERYEYLCGPEWWGERIRTAVDSWSYHHPNMVGDIYMGLAVTAVLVALLVLLKIQKRLAWKTKSRGIPYNILEEQQVSTVSGSRVDV